jgi:uncharacterized delta-60 repeat protein
MKKVFVLLHLALISLISYGQVGTIDKSFNSSDLGFAQGDGFDDDVNEVLSLSNGKILVVGGFNKYNNKFVNKIVKLNSDGSIDTTFNNGDQISSSLSTNIYCALELSNGKFLIGGDYNGINGVSQHRINCLNSDGSIDSSFIFDENITTGTITNLRQQNDGKILLIQKVTNQAGCSIKRINIGGTIDSTFNQGTGPDNGTSYITEISFLEIQSDGKILLGGGFNSFGGYQSKYVVRLNSNGSPDTTFSSGITSFLNSSLNALTIQSDGKIILGGGFIGYGGSNKDKLVRLNSDGSIDNSFDFSSPFYGLSLVQQVIENSDGTLYIVGQTNASFAEDKLIKVFSDGTVDTSMPIKVTPGDISSIKINKSDQIIIGGDFITHQGEPCSRNLIVLNPDFSIDSNFNTGMGISGRVNRVAEQADGKFVLVGEFDRFNNYPCGSITRVNPDGSRDISFTPGDGVDHKINAVVIQSDGKIVIGGSFSYYNGVQIGDGIARLMPDGSLDTTFSATTNGRYVNDLGITSDGKILVGGNFEKINSSMIQNGIARLKSNGGVDSTFQTLLNNSAEIKRFSIQPSGKILISGFFDRVNGTLMRYVARLNQDGTNDITFNNNLGTGISSYSKAFSLSNNKIIITGNYQVSSNSNCIRLNEDGTLDPSFILNDPLMSAVKANEVIEESNGKLIITGVFGYVLDSATNLFSHFHPLRRLNVDGSMDTTFNLTGKMGLGTNEDILSHIITADENLLIGGSFNNYNNIGANRIAKFKLHNSVITKIEDSNNQNISFQLFPNPNRGSFTVKSPKMIKQLNIYDQRGKLIQTEFPGSLSINIKLKVKESGFYFLQLVTDKEVKTQKVIIE